MYRLLTASEQWQGYIDGQIDHLPYEAYRRDAPQSHATWHFDGRLVARCSLWWSNTPNLDGRRIGAIGHYASFDHSAGVQLLSSACKTLRQQGCALAVGPMDGNTWRNYRITIESDGGPSFFLEPRLPISTVNDFVDSGFSLLATYRSAVCEALRQCDPRIQRVKNRMDSMNVSFRCLDVRQSMMDLEAIHRLTLDAYRDSFLFHPISFESFCDQFEPLLNRIEPSWIQLAEHDGRVVGYAFGTPDLLRSSYGLAEDTAILKTLAVNPHRTYAGLGLLLMQRFQDFTYQRGFQRVIHALMHDENLFIQNLSSRYAKPMRKYGLFSRDLS